MTEQTAFFPRPRAGEPGVFDVYVDPELRYFRGHFPGEPILAGVVQVEVLVRRQIEALWPDLTRLRRVNRLRFRSLIRPRDALELRLSRASASLVNFEIRRAGKMCSAGALQFAEAPL